MTGNRESRRGRPRPILYQLPHTSPSISVLCVSTLLKSHTALLDELVHKISDTWWLPRSYVGGEHGTQAGNSHAEGAVNSGRVKKVGARLRFVGMPRSNIVEELATAHSSIDLF